MLRARSGPRTRPGPVRSGPPVTPDAPSLTHKIRQHGTDAPLPHPPSRIGSYCAHAPPARMVECRHGELKPRCPSGACRFKSGSGHQLRRGFRPGEEPGFTPYGLVAGDHREAVSTLGPVGANRSLRPSSSSNSAVSGTAVSPEPVLTAPALAGTTSVFPGGLARLRKPGQSDQRRGRSCRGSQRRAGASPSVRPCQSEAARVRRPHSRRLPGHRADSLP